MRWAIFNGRNSTFTEYPSTEGRNKATEMTGVIRQHIKNTEIAIEDTLLT